VRISGEGKIGIVLALVFGAGTGVIAVFPDQPIFGWATIAASGVGAVLLGGHHFFGWFISPAEANSRNVFAPDIRINDALDYIVNDSCALIKHPEPPEIMQHGPMAGQRVQLRGAQHADALAQINAKLNAGEIDAWGLRQINGSSPPQFEGHIRPIDKGYWSGAQLDFLYCFHHTETLAQTAKIPRQAVPSHWSGLMLSRKQVERVWPRKAAPLLWWARFTKASRISYRI